MNNKLEPRSGGDCDEGFDTFPVWHIPAKAGVFKAEINGYIRSPEQFSGIVQALEYANEDNPMEIHLQSGGGSLDATDRLIHAMRKCEGKIKIIATGGCHSAASIILLEADEFELSDDFSCLIHCGSLGNIGNFNEYAAQAEFDVRRMKKVMQSAYEGFLTEQEIADLIKGQDIWLDAEDWCKRWNARNEWLKNKVGEDVRAVLAQFEQEQTSVSKPARKPRKKKED